MVARTVLGMSLALVAAGCGASSDPGQPPVAADPGPTPAGGTSGVTLPNAASQRGEVLRGPLVYVSDGDTIGVRLGGAVQRVRLLGIDSPETKDPDEPVACYGPQSSARAQALMPRGTPITLVTDPTQDRIDKFGRLLAYVFRTGQPLPINQQLVADGAARVYVFRRNRPPLRIGAFRRAETAAKAAKRGLWGACSAQ